MCFVIYTSYSIYQKYCFQTSIALEICTINSFFPQQLHILLYCFHVLVFSVMCRNVIAIRIFDSSQPNLDPSFISMVAKYFLCLLFSLITCSWYYMDNLPYPSEQWDSAFFQSSVCWQMIPEYLFNSELGFVASSVFNCPYWPASY